MALLATPQVLQQLLVVNASNTSRPYWRLGNSTAASSSLNAAVKFTFAGMMVLLATGGLMIAGAGLLAMMYHTGRLSCYRCGHSAAWELKPSSNHIPELPQYADKSYGGAKGGHELVVRPWPAMPATPAGDAAMLQQLTRHANALVQASAAKLGMELPEDPEAAAQPSLARHSIFDRWLQAVAPHYNASGMRRNSVDMGRGSVSLGRGSVNLGHGSVDTRRRNSLDMGHGGGDTGGHRSMDMGRGSVDTGRARRLSVLSAWNGLDELVQQ